MAAGQGLRLTIQIILGILIVVLAYVLYVSITEPYNAIERQQELTRLTRERMSQVRTAMTMYERENDRFLTSLDSLVDYVKTDSLISVSYDSLFGPGFMPDSLPYSPRTGSRFELQVNDTSRVKIYMLKDPDSNDRIGAIQPDVTLLNAASWE